MYSEQMMREQGFDATPAHRDDVHTDAIWRACRIILDIQLHRGEISVDDAIDFLVEQTGLRATERRGRGPPLHLHADLPAELPAGQGAAPAAARGRAAAPGRRLLAARASTTRCCTSGSIPVSFHRRLLAGEGGGPIVPADAGPRTRLMQVIPSIDIQARSIATGLVAGRRDRRGRADRPAGAHRRGVRRAGCADHPPGRPRRCASRAAGQPDGHRGGRARRRRAAPAGRRRRWTGADRAGLRGRRDARRRAAVGRGRGPCPAARRACAIAGDWLAVGLDARPERLRDYPWKRFLPPTLDELVARARRRRCPALRAVTWRQRAGPGAERPAAAGGAAEILVAGGVQDLAEVVRLRSAGVRGLILGEVLLARARLPGGPRRCRVMIAALAGRSGRFGWRGPPKVTPFQRHKGCGLLTLGTCRGLEPDGLRA